MNFIEIVGAGGKGAIPTNNYEFAKLWIDRPNDWGRFMAAEPYSNDTVNQVAMFIHIVVVYYLFTSVRFKVSVTIALPILIRRKETLPVS